MLANQKIPTYNQDLKELKMAKDSKTSQAVAFFLDNQERGVTVYAAAKQFEVDTASIYKRLKLLSKMAGQRCPTCFQTVPTEK